MKKFATLLLGLGLFSCANAALIKSYDFNGNYTDTNGNGLNLVASGGSLSNSGFYTFTANQGLRLDSALADISNYAIELRLRFDDSVSGWNKLIDFRTLDADNGLYVRNGALNYYRGGSNNMGGSITTGEFFTLAFVRSGSTLSAFLNNTALGSVSNDRGDAVAPDNILNFFVDDNRTGQRESFAGTVDFIRIHNDASTLGTSPTPPTQAVPEPKSLLVIALGVLGLGFARRLRKR